MSAREITTIFFDIGKVLVGFDHSLIWQRLAAFSDLTPDSIQQRILDSGMMQRHEIGELAPQHFFREIQRAAALRPSLSYEMFCHSWQNIFWEYPDMLRLAQVLQQRYAVGVLSNVGELHWNWVLASYPLFQTISERLRILSFHVGAMKPAAAIYRHALRQSQSTPEQCVYIDDLEDNVRAGRALGMRSIHFQSAEQVTRELRASGVTWKD